MPNRDFHASPRRARFARLRRPAAIPAWVLLVVALHFGMFSTYSLVMGSLSWVMDREPFAVLRWGALAALVSLLMLLARPLLSRLSNGRPPGASLSAWGATFGVYALLAFGAAWLRSVLAPWALGFTLDPWRFWQFVIQFCVPLMGALMAIELYLSRRQARLDWLAVSERLECELAERRFDLVELDDQIRRDASHHLHGEVQSHLFMAWTLLKQAQRASSSEAARSQVSQASEHLAHLRTQALRQARDLLGASESGRPLSQRVEDLVARFGAVLPVTLDLAPSIAQLEARLAPEGRHHALLLLEEAMLNAFRHGHPSRIYVRLHVEASVGSPVLILEVSDDGAGFAPELAGKGLGLSALRDELEHAGGRLDVHSRSGHGTRVTLRLPLVDVAPERSA
ncbi:Redox sensor histidine kinase response regulator DevS [compost metagenome]